MLSGEREGLELRQRVEQYLGGVEVGWEWDFRGAVGGGKSVTVALGFQRRISRLVGMFWKAGVCGRCGLRV